MSIEYEWLPQFTLPMLLCIMAAIAIGWLLLRKYCGPKVQMPRYWHLAVLRGLLVVLLFLLIANPVRVTTTESGAVPRDFAILLDTSSSMSIDDKGASRWQQAAELAAEATKDIPRDQASIRFYRYGRRLAAIPESERAQMESIEVDFEDDTQLAAAMRQLTNRFGTRPPAGIAVLSDGRARDATSIADVARRYRELKVPVHTVPFGNITQQGDVALVSMIAPPQVRQHTASEVSVFLRSYGFDGQSSTVDLETVQPDGVVRKLASQTVVFSDGFQSIVLPFTSDATMSHLRVRCHALAGEVAVENNLVETDIEVQRTKVRVLYVEGSETGTRSMIRDGRVVLVGAHTPLHEALSEDPDIECKTMIPVGGTIQAFDGGYPPFPRASAELYQYDVIVLSNVRSDQFTEDQLAWLDEWVSVRGAGLCMVGGPTAYGSGGWDSTVVGQILPVSSGELSSWVEEQALRIYPAMDDDLHPLFQLLDDKQHNTALLQSFPNIRGFNVGLIAKESSSTTLASAMVDDEFSMEISASNGKSAATPTIVVGQYGRGRTLALAFPVTAPAAEAWHSWGDAGNRHFGRFWRNAVYWLSESSFSSRRRLTAVADKQYYQPSDRVNVHVSAFDDAFNATTNYRVVATIEPQSLDISSDYAPLRWPNGVERLSGDKNPLVVWGEEFEVTPQKDAEGREGYALEMPFAGALAVGSSTGVRLVLTAYQNGSLVDSTSLALQVLHDPFELQSPLPDHQLLTQLAKDTGGEVIHDSKHLAEVIRSAPADTRPPVRHLAPAWSNWWLLLLIMALLSSEWICRRRMGLA